MNIENSELKLERQQKQIADLTSENETLYQQYNHLMVRNGKLLKRIDDMQQIINDLHIRIQEMQLTNQNLLKMTGGAPKNGHLAETSNEVRLMIDNMNRRIEELHLRKEINNLRSQRSSNAVDDQATLDLNAAFETWKNFPGQQAKNAPNMRKQIQMLAHLYESKKLSASELFSRTGINGVTGARYVAVLKKFNLIEYKGARKKGEYYITEKGCRLFDGQEPAVAITASLPTPAVASSPAAVTSEKSEVAQINTERVNEFKNVASQEFRSPVPGAFKTVMPQAEKPFPNHFEHFDL